MKRLDLTALESLKGGAAGWWTGLSARERMLLGVLGAILGVIILVYGIIGPLQSSRAEALADIRTYETLNARLRSAGGALGRQTMVRSGPAASIITSSAGQFGVVIGSSQAEAGGTRVALADAPFEGVMRWIADIEQNSALRVASLRIERKPSPGTVSADILFAE